MLYTKIRELLKKVPNITRFLKDNSLPTSYLGIRYFIAGKQNRIGKNGMKAIMDQTGYTLFEVPVRLPEDKEAVEKIQRKFLDDFEDYLKKFENDKPTHRRQNKEIPEIENILTDFDSSESNDLGISMKDLF